MKLLSLGNKKSAIPSPTERVLTLSSQGLSEPEIIQTLREEGYKPVDVDRAMTEALRGAASGMRLPRAAPEYAQPPAPDYSQTEYAPPQRAAPPMAPQRKPYAEPPAYDDLADEQEEEPLYAPKAQEPPEPPMEELPEPPMEFEQFKRSNKDLGMPEFPPRDAPPAREPPRMRGLQPREAFRPDEGAELPEEEELRPVPRMAGNVGSGETRHERRRMIEELTEGVVEEKWEGFRRRIDDMNMRFRQLNERLSSLEDKLGEEQGGKRSDLMEIEDKIDTYKKSMDEVESRMESVERAVKDSLTPMMETLRSLSDAIKSMKEKRQ